MSLDEQSARRQLGIAASASTISAFIAISLGLNRMQGLAVVFLLVAVAAAIFAWLAYRRYSNLRQTRWDTDLASAARAALSDEAEPGTDTRPDNTEPLEG